MRNAASWLMALPCVALLVAATSAGDKDADPEPPGWVKLFNGRDLKGWKVFPGGAGKWVVKDGAMTCSGPISHLFTEKGDYKDFHLRVQAKINAQGNSGVYFRTKFERTSYPAGWEAQIAADGDRIKTGGLYPPAGQADLKAVKGLTVLKPTHKADEWFTLEVICKGGHMELKVDGKVTMDWKDPKNRFEQGHIALQHHNPRTSIQVRKVEIMSLPAAK